jgi:phosphate transport system substrate-binding protein
MRCNLPRSFRLIVASAVGGLLLIPGCGSNSTDTKESVVTKTIRVRGSDTMVNLAKAWADKYYQKRPDVAVQVSGGSGVDGLTNNTCDLGDTSRKMNNAEIEQFKQKRGSEPIEHVVGYDSIAIYVNKRNPLDSISIEELAEIYGDGGKITKWSQLGVTVPKVKGNKIVRIGRQSGSGTQVLFREAVLGEKRDYKPGAVEESGSKEVVTLVAHTPAAIGYSGMGYKTNDVKVLKVSLKKGEPGIEPTVENTRNGCYPITRSLQIYTAGPPSGAVKEYLDWIVSPEGQQVILDQGYVPPK